MVKMTTTIIDSKLEGLFGKLTKEQKDFLTDMHISPRDFETEKLFSSSYAVNLHDEILDIFLDEYNGDENELTEEFDKYLNEYFELA